MGRGGGCFSIDFCRCPMALGGFFACGFVLFSKFVRFGSRTYFLLDFQRILCVFYWGSFKTTLKHKEMSFRIILEY